MGPSGRPVFPFRQPRRANGSLALKRLGAFSRRISVLATLIAGNRLLSRSGKLPIWSLTQPGRVSILLTFG